MKTEKLFTYGTLCDEPIQLRLFGRLLSGTPDEFCGYQLSTVTVHEAEASGIFPIVIYTGNEENKIVGMVYELTPKDLENADRYEGKEYRRIQVKLSSGVTAWAYVE